MHKYELILLTVHVKIKVIQQGIWQVKAGNFLTQKYLDWL